MLPTRISLTPGKRVLFLTKDPQLIERQLRGELNLTLDAVTPADLLDDINTDTMVPGWTGFDHEPEEIARHAYAGLIVNGNRLFATDALRSGNFEVIVSGERKGTGSSRETAVQAEKWSGIRIAIAASFAPIHARNNVCQGVLMADYAVLRRLQRGELVALEDFMEGRDEVERQVISCGGLFAWTREVEQGRLRLPSLPLRAARPMTMVEKVLSRHCVGASSEPVLAAGDTVVVSVDAGYSHDYTSAQVDYFLRQEFGAGYTVKNPTRFAAFEDHLVYAEQVPALRPFAPKIERSRALQRQFLRHTGVRDYSARDGIAPGICHQVAREDFIEPGDFVQATDSHTCMGGASNALAWGVGSTEYAALLRSGMTAITVPPSVRFELQGSLRPGVAAKDLMLHLLATRVRDGTTLGRVMEFGGPGLAEMSMDERATVANMATECAARTAIFEADEATFAWLHARRPHENQLRWRQLAVAPDAGAYYEGGVHVIALDTIEPMVATPGDPDRGIPADPTNGALVADIGEVHIDIAYGGSCTAGKEVDMDLYAVVVAEALCAGKSLPPGVEFYIQFGSATVASYARTKGYLDLFKRAGIRVIDPGCGACIACGPGVSTSASQVTVSAINRNFRGRSGPGSLWLASPLTVAASAFEGRITAWRPGLWPAKTTNE